MCNKQIFIILVAIIAVIILSCSATQPQTIVTAPDVRQPINPISLKTFIKHGVEVALVLEEEPLGHYHLAATYSPLYELYHLYSKDLPPTGIDGIGRPTRLEIVSGPLEAVGDLQENISPLEHRFVGFDKPFPIYPDGPVTLRLPVKLAKPSQGKPSIAELSVTYTACSNKGVCLLPVFGEVFSITVPVTLTNRY